jgi:hypothetical protein
VAVAVSSSGPALADTADTGGTATISMTGSFLTGLAKSNVVVLPGTPTTSSYANGLDAYTVPVTGGNGEVSTFFGTVDLGGSLVLINGASGKTVTITNLELNLFTGALTGAFAGGTHQTALAYLTGDISTSSSAGPPATETLSADEIHLSLKAAAALNTSLATTVFKRGTNIGTFTTTFDVTIT